MKGKNIQLGLVAVAATFVLGGCASTTDWQNPTINGNHALGEAATGAAIGGVTGALIGKAAGGDATTGAMAGAAIGGATGAVHGYQKDRRYRSGY